jgi:multisubunit Na+/H+ antiporter MnhB subunit
MTPGWLMDAGLAVSVVGLALLVVLARGMFTSVVGFVVLGLPLAVVWVRLGAVDVALTEAALVSGATGMLLLAALARLRGAEARIEPEGGSTILRLLAGLLAGAVGVAVAVAVLLLPETAPSLAPAVSHDMPALGIGNPVAGVLMGFRALDTLLGCAALVFALVAVWSFAPDRFWGGIPGPAHAMQRRGPLLLLARVLAPVALLVGIYLAWIGADAPGGKFQGGAVLATGLIILWLAGLAQPPPVARRWLRVVAVAGPLVFVGVGLAGMVFADAFLAFPPGLAKPLISLIEAAMAVSCAAIIALLVAGPPERAA